MNVLDLFSGIGGFSLGLERAGMRTVAFCEIDPFCRKVLKKHWPRIPCYEDIRELTADRLRADGIAVDVICGGFPCQDISVAGRGGGIEGERSGLWSEYARIIGELRPAFAIVENVAALLGRGLGRVLGDLAEIGFNAAWHCIPASAVGAPHRRDRIWIIAADAGSDKHESNSHEIGRAIAAQLSREMADPASPRCSEGQSSKSGTLRDEARRSQSERLGGDVANSALVGQQRAGSTRPGRDGFKNGGEISYAAHHAAIGEGIGRSDAAGQWRIEPNVGRVAHGVPSRVDRLRSLGNAVVPQIPEIIGRAIMSLEHDNK